MEELPAEILDVMAEFAAGVRDWEDWRKWFNMRAADLSRMIDRSLFRLLKADPQSGVTAILHAHNVAIIPEEIQGNVETLPVTAEEYEIFTELCKQTDLFQFQRPGTLFDNLTSDDVIGNRSRRRGRVAFDAERREYRVVRWRLQDQFAEWPIVLRRPEMIEQFEQRNLSRWHLDKSFEVANGYRFVSELDSSNAEDISQAFTLSRVGFSKDLRGGLVFIRYGMCCGYYVVFDRIGHAWQKAGAMMSWVT